MRNCTWRDCCLSADFTPVRELVEAADDLEQYVKDPDKYPATKVCRLRLHVSCLLLHTAVYRLQSDATHCMQQNAT